MGSHPLRWQPRSSKARHNLDAAERILSYASPGPPMSGNMPHVRPNSPLGDDWVDSGMSNPWEKVEEPIDASLAIEPSGRGYRDLGLVDFRDGDYKRAIGPLTTALKISPASPGLNVYLQQARQAPYMKTWAKQHLPTKQQVRNMLPFPVKGRNLWIVLSSEQREHHFENALISVFEEHRHRRTLLWRSPNLASIARREYFSTDLWAFPMTGRKVPELVFLGVCTGGSANPTRMLIYHWTGRTFRQVLDAGSGEQSLWIDDLHHTGRYQVRCVRLVGKELGHSAQVRWADVYDWNGKRYVEANAKYTDAFRQTKRDLLARLRTHPDDPALLKYLARAYRQEGRRKLALVFLHRMERACTELIKEDPADIDSWWNLGESAEQTRHRARAVRCFGTAQRISRALAKKVSDPDDLDYYLNFAKKASKRITALHRPAK